jgi:magnesium transporter
MPLLAFLRKSSEVAGLAPGTPVFVGSKRTDEVSIEVVDYTREEYRRIEPGAAADVFPYRDSPTVSWVNIRGLHDSDLVSQIGAHFGIPPLVLEDILNTGHRPKFEDSEEQCFAVVKKLLYEDDGDELATEQVSIVFAKNWLLSFQERYTGVFDAVRERVKRGPRVRMMTTDYLAYALIDAVVDDYFLVLENVGERLEELETEVMEQPQETFLAELLRIKKELTFIRRAAWPLRDLVSGFLRAESDLVQESTQPYLKDLQDHVLQVVDTIDTFRDVVTGLEGTYMSNVGNRTNDVMKVLTIIATIFIPLGFLAGVYGMNFDPSAGPLNMPELGLPFGYLLFWAIAVVVTGGLVLFFRRKGWF